MTRRAIALILVLVVLVLATAAAAAAAQVSIAARSRQTVSDRAHLAHALLRAADDRIQVFLSTQSVHVVLPPQALDPSFPVSRDAFTLGGTPASLAITAYDQCGMVPWGLARPGSPLRAGLPPDIARAWDDALDHLTPSHTPGLDLVDLASDAASPVVFPSPAAEKPALGSLIATHNPDPAAHAGPTLSDAGLINVNTAPRPLLERALRATAVGGLEEILDARSRRQLAAGPAPSPGATTSLRLASQSDCWSFRVDIQVSSVRQSWWCTYRAIGPQWRCVQRVLLPD